MEKFYIYYHQDFDGIISAIVIFKLLSMLKLINKNNTVFIGVDYNKNKNWRKEKLQKQNAVVDFKFHEDADWWFDHHTTSFNNYKEKVCFKNTKTKYWNSDYKACPQLIIDHFKKEFPILLTNDEYFNFEDKCADLVYWSDIIDSASYKDPMMIYNKKYKFIALSKTIKNNDEYQKKIINYLIDFKIDELFQDNEICKNIDEIYNNENDNLNNIKRYINIESGVCYYDISTSIVKFDRYISYRIDKNVDYTLALYNRNNQYCVSIGHNPWKGDSLIDIGKMCKRYGGGGRRNVGAIISDDYLSAKHIFNKIKHYLIKNYITPAST